MSAALRRSTPSASAVTAAIKAPCQMKCRSAQPMAWAAGCRSSGSIAIITVLPAIDGVLFPGPRLVPRGVNGPADFAQLVGGRAPRRERLHHELRRRSAERAIHEVADQLPLRLFLGQPRAVDVRAVALVAVHQPLLRHDLEELERGGVAGGALPPEDFVHLAH